MRRNIIFWAIFAAAVAAVYFGAVQGDILETRMESSAL